MEIELAKQRLDRLALVGGKLLLGQPAPPLVPEEVGRRTAGHEVAVQDRLHLVLEPRALADDVRAAAFPPPWPCAAALVARVDATGLRLHALGLEAGVVFPAAHDDLAVARVELEQPRAAAHVLAGHERRARAAEGVEHDVATHGRVGEAILDQLDRLHGRMSATRVWLRHLEDRDLAVVAV